jgi:hypothetical protein
VTTLSAYSRLLGNMVHKFDYEIQNGEILFHNPQLAQCFRRCMEDITLQFMGTKDTRASKDFLACEVNRFLHFIRWP